MGLFVYKLAWLVLGLVTLFGVSFSPEVAGAPIASAQEVKALQVEEIDPRYEQLNKFFDKYKCPEPRYTKEYVEIADKYEIDYRLLPSISLKESTCGKHVPYKCENHWGWLIYGKNRRCFESVPAGIEEVLKNFGTNPKWMGTVDKILYRYNGSVEKLYPSRVKNIMEQI